MSAEAQSDANRGTEACADSQPALPLDGLYAVRNTNTVLLQGQSFPPPRRKLLPSNQIPDFRGISSPPNGKPHVLTKNYELHARIRQN